MAVRVVEPGVVGDRRDARTLEHAGNAIDRAARRGVDDGLPVPLAQRVHERQVAVGIRARGDHVVVQIGAVEARDHGARPVERQLPDDVLANFGRGRGGERDGGRRPEPLAHGGEAEVAGAEIVSPLAHAVRFIHREKRHADGAQAIGEAPEVEALRRHVKELDLPALDAGQAARDLAARERGVHAGGGKTARGQRIHLILHEGDERRHDDRELRQHERGHLEAERLSAARGEDDEGVPTLEHRFHGTLLPGPEIRVAEVLAQGAASVVEGELAHDRTMPYSTRQSRITA